LPLRNENVRYLGTDLIPPELLPADDRILHSEIQKLLISIWHNKKLYEGKQLLYPFIKGKMIVV